VHTIRNALTQEVLFWQRDCNKKKYSKCVTKICFC